MIKSGKTYSYWLARFNRKMSFHFPWVVPLISDRPVWHNGKQPILHEVRLLQVQILCFSLTSITVTSTLKRWLGDGNFYCRDDQRGGYYSTIQRSA